MEPFLTIVITLSILLLAFKFGDFFVALWNFLFLSVVLVVLIGFVALFVWTIVSGP